MTSLTEYVPGNNGPNLEQPCPSDPVTSVRLVPKGPSTWTVQPFVKVPNAPARSVSTPVTILQTVMNPVGDTTCGNGMVLAPMLGALMVPWFVEPCAPPAPSREIVVQLHRLYAARFVLRIAPGPVVMQNSGWLPPPGPPIAVF